MSSRKQERNSGGRAAVLHFPTDSPLVNHKYPPECRNGPPIWSQIPHQLSTDWGLIRTLRARRLVVCWVPKEPRGVRPKGCKVSPYFQVVEVTSLGITQFNVFTSVCMIHRSASAQQCGRCSVVCRPGPPFPFPVPCPPPYPPALHTVLPTVCTPRARRPISRH